MTYSENQIQSMVRQVLERTLGPNGIVGEPGPNKAAASAAEPTGAITEADIRGVPKGSTMAVPDGAVVTPLARDTALERKVKIVRNSDSLTAETKTSGPASGKVVALGADHGGYAMKEDLKIYVQELGYQVADCGTHSTASVDYPDLAYAVAKMVANSQAWRGIIVDGAGIGSCMAANKVPGVRAAMCYDHATAFNSREHNDANVLTLGGVLVGGALARQIVKTWLETDFGGGRHGRRVDKIMAVERRFLKR
jgi:ribose 5-phosphate isomerase B